jgi:hypothetical protein
MLWTYYGVAGMGITKILIFFFFEALFMFLS